MDSYQKDTKGKKVRDSYGSDYPDQVTFPLISKAKNDGYVPLQVFVPIMDAISPGSGTQAVYLKLDLNSIKAVKNSKEFVSNDKNTEKSSTTMTTNSSNTSSAGSHENYQRQHNPMYRDNQLWKKKVLILIRFQHQQTVEVRHCRKMRKKHRS